MNLELILSLLRQNVFYSIGSSSYKALRKRISCSLALHTRFRGVKVENIKKVPKKSFICNRKKLHETNIFDSTARGKCLIIAEKCRKKLPRKGNCSFLYLSTIEL